MKRIILCLSFFAFFGSQAQQINPVPDYVFSNKMSVGRNAVTDTAAYFSIGPRYGAIRGMMPPMVTDTASMSATKRNGLLIFSIQKNKYLYWDSVGSKWAEMAGTAGSAITGSGVAGYMPEFTTSTNLDTTRLYHSAGRFGIGTTSPANELHVVGNIRLGASNAYQIGNDDKSFSITNRVTNTRALVIDTANSIFFGTLTTANGAGSTLSVNMQNSSVNVANTLNVTDTATFSGRGLFNDRVGIGTSAPASLLHVNGTNGRIRTTGGNHGFEFDNGRTGFVSGGSDIIHIYTSGNVRGLFQADGEFLVNTLTDAGAYALQVAGAVYATGNLNFATGDISISNISNNVLAFGTNNTERMRIGANGDVAIGTTNADPFTRGDDRRIAMDASGISSTANVALSLNAGSSAGRGAQLYLGVGGTRHFEISSNSVEQGISAISNTYIKFLTNNTERMRLKADGEVLIGTTTDAGAYALQVSGAIYNTTTITTGAPSGGTAKPFKIGAAATVSPTSPNRTIEIEIDGTTYYLHAKTTND